MKYLKKIIFATSFAISIILISCAIEIDIPDLNFEPTSDTSITPPIITPTPPIITPDPDSAPIFSARFPVLAVFDDKLWALGGYDGTADDSCNGANNYICYDIWSSSNGKDWSLEADSALNFLEEVGIERTSFTTIVFNKEFDEKIVIFYDAGGSSTTPPTTDIWASSNGKDWNQVTTDIGDFDIRRALVVGDKIIASLSLHGEDFDSGLYQTTNLKTWNKITIDPQSPVFFGQLYNQLYYHEDTYFVYDASSTPYDPSKPDGFDNPMLLGYDIYTSPDLSTWTKGDFFSFTIRSSQFKIINLASKSYLFSYSIDEVSNNIISEIYTNDNPTTANWHKLTQNIDFVFGNNVVYFKEKFFAISSYDFNKKEYLNGTWTWSGIEGEAWQKIR